jgi:amidohydrolase
MMADQNAAIRESITQAYPEMVRLRRELHAIPEIAFNEERTAKRIAEELRRDYSNVGTGIAETGVTALLEGDDAAGRKQNGLPVRAILLRADMDALPIPEETGLPFSSTNGSMHACGHDGHMSVMLNAARLAVAGRDRIGGVVRFVFQPAEEGPGGAMPMIDQGILVDPPIECAFGLHLWAELPIGKVAVTSGPMMAAADEFEIIVRGKGGHGAYPQNTVDAVMVGCQLVVALQALVARETDPFQTAVISIGTFNAGSRFNVIAETARLTGTLRTFDVTLRDRLIRRLGEVAQGICSTLGAQSEFQFRDHYPPLVNDPRMADFVATIAADVVGRDNVLRDFVSMGGEDMAYFLRAVPGAYFFVGAGNPENGISHPHHSPHFDFDEAAMPIGVEILMQIMERYWKAFPA